MTSALRTDFLKDLLLKNLRDSKQFPKQLPTTVHPLQIVQFTTFREPHETQKPLVAFASDKFTSIMCKFTAECCNDFERKHERRLSEMTGGLIYPQNWFFKVVKLPTSGELAGAIEIRGLKYIGNEGEGLIGEPYNFNSYPDVINLLKDPNRQSIYIPPSPTPNQEYSGQQDTTVPFQTQRVPAPQKAPSAHQPKRRKGSKDHPEWNNVKSVAYKGYQVTAGQIGMLDNDASWVTPETIEKKGARPTQEEEEMLPTPQPLVRNGEGHPPLGSPGSPSQAVEEQSQFETQAPPLLAESELREEQARLESQTDAKEEEEEEKALSWSASPPPEQKNTEPPSSSPLWPPAIETGNDETDHPPLDSEEEPEEMGERNQEDGEEVEHEETEVLFEEDKVKEDVEMDVDVPPSTLVVSTAEIMTQNADTKTEEIVENIPEDVDAEQDEGEKMHIEEQEAVLQGDNSEEQRETVEEVEQTILGSSEKKEARLSTGEVIRDSASQTLSKDPQATTNLHSQPILTTQDDSFTSQYPTSSSANQPTSTQHPSDDSQQHLPSQQPSSNARASETPVFHPPTDFASRHTSPPKATPVPPQISSAQVQVTETPLQAQKPQQPLVPSSVTHITSTLPVNQSSPLKEPIGESRRKHKRDRHVGPIIPRFSRKEKKMKIDLQALLFEDHRKFMGIRAGQPAQREDEDVEMKDVIQEVIEEVVDETAEEVVEEVVEKEVNEDAEERMEEEQHQEDVRAVAKEGEREAIEIVDQDEDDKIVEEIVEERITKTIQEPPAAGEPMVTQAEVVETQESSQTFDVSASRWGRFISHWKRFS